MSNGFVAAKVSSCCQLDVEDNRLAQPLCSGRITGLHRSYGLVRPCAPHWYARLVVVATWTSPLASALPHFWWSSRPAGCSNVLECRAFVDFSRRPDRELAAGGRAAQNCGCFQWDHSSRTNSFPPKVRESQYLGSSPSTGSKRVTSYSPIQAGRPIRRAQTVTVSPSANLWVAIPCSLGAPCCAPHEPPSFARSCRFPLRSAGALLV